MSAADKPSGIQQVMLPDPVWKKFVFGGMACQVAAAATNPIDVIKVRLQLQGELGVKGNVAYKGFLRGMGTIVQTEGVLGLYKGLFASVIREGSYSSIRMGAYEPIREVLGEAKDGITPLWKKIVAGALSGAAGSALATPTDLLKVRLQAQGPGAPRYPSTLRAFGVIYREEGGLRGLYRGLGPTVQRAMILTAFQLPSYDHSKNYILKYKLMQEGVALHLTCSMIAGLVAAALTSPVDLVKTRVMNQKPDANGVLPYRNTFDCFVKTARAEGPMGLFKGFFPNWMRIGPHTIVTFLVYEKLRQLAGMKPV